MLRNWWRAIVGTLLVAGGAATAAVTWLGRQAGDWEVARLGAILSLVFVALITIFVVPPLLRSARREVARFDPAFQVTTGGVIVVGIFLVVGFAAYNTGNNLLFLIFSVLTSTLFVAWAAARASLRDLVVSARFPDHIFAGEPAPVHVQLHNTKRALPSFSILVEARCRADEPAHDDAPRPPLRRRRRRARFIKRPLAYFLHVPHRTRGQQRVEQTFDRRGHVLVTGFELSTRFPFGLFRLRRHLHAPRDVDLVIYPKPEPLGDELHLLPMSAGRMLSARRGAGHDLHSLRDYQAQDDVRHIDWKATARARRLMVREFTAEDLWRVHIVFDTRLQTGAAEADVQPLGAEHDKDAATRFERGVTLAASLVAHFIEERADVQLTLGDQTGTYGGGREHLYASLRRLALARPTTGVTARTAATPPDYLSAIAASATDDAHYVILLTTAAPGTIPGNLWRRAHVIYL
ncbi:MAG TPA: DUF58 domain-containing protein [Pyrinomonadaceae bacterium]|jgi:uncharacterized protein (DUF58 family)